MKTRHFPPTRGLDLAQQFLLLRRDFPHGDGQIRAGRMIWRQSIQPTPISRRYIVRLRYANSLSPETMVEEPRLVNIAGDRRIPHLYKQDPAQLCLYRPSNYEWSSRQALSQTIIPWAALWLFYFEDWLTSGEWSGGGQHPN